MQSLIVNSLKNTARLPAVSSVGKLALNPLKPTLFNTIRPFSRTPLTRECKFLLYMNYK